MWFVLSLDGIELIDLVSALKLTMNNISFVSLYCDFQLIFVENHWMGI